MTNWSIVAIPEVGETVWHVSSEKVPHLTLLHLGEQNDPDKAIHIAAYLEHAIGISLNKFGAEVKTRGVLGDKAADVLVFETNHRIKDLTTFRSHLLSDAVIRECYDSAEQFPSWLPHLTLGYPNAPAKKPPAGLHSLPIYSVYFDKIALWVDDFDGPSFELDYKNSYDMAQDSIAHRNKERAMLHTPAVTQRDVVMRNVIARQARSEPDSITHHEAGASKFNYKHPVDVALGRMMSAAGREAMELSKEGRFIKHAVSGELQPGSTKDAKARYVEENQRAFLRHLDKAMGGRLSEKANRRFDLVARPDDDWLLSVADLVAHSGTVHTRIHPQTDDYGMIVGYSLVHDELTQEDLRQAIVHFGVKGMKWGVRRKSSDSSSSAGESGGSSKPKGSAGPGTNNASTKTKAELKADKKAAKKFDRKATFVKPKKAEEAETAAVARKRTKDHGTDVLTNKELKDLVTRMNLEQQLVALKANEKATKSRSAGREYVADILKTAGREIAIEAIKGAANEAAKGAYGQATNSDSRSRTYVRNQRQQQRQLPPAMRELLQLEA